MSIQAENNKVTVLKAIFYGESHWSRLILAASALIWCLLLALDPNVESRPGLRVLNDVIHHYHVSGVFLFSACVQLIILFNRKLINRIILPFDIFNAMLWCYVVSSIVISNFPPPPTISTEFVIAMISLWVLLRSGTETTDDVGKHGTKR